MNPSERHRGRPRKGAEHDTDSLLEAALASFAEHGFDKTPLRAIATRAGVDVALISYRFGSKLGLWKAVVGSVSEASILQAEDFLRQAETLPLDQRLKFISANLVDLIFQRPAFAKLLLTELIVNIDDERKELISQTLMQPMHDTIMSSLRTLKLDKEINNLPDPGLSLVMAIASVALISSTETLTMRFTELNKDRERLRDDLAALVSRILEQR